MQVNITFCKTQNALSYTIGIMVKVMKCSNTSYGLYLVNNISGDRIDRLKSAIELQAAHGRYHENPRGRGRGSYRRPYGNRGGFRNNRDVFQAVTSRNVPHHRPDERQDHDN
jgi:hypothetical protein